MNLETLQQKALELIINYTPKLIAALAIIVIGFAVTKILMKIFDKFLEKSRVDASLHSFMKSIAQALLKIAIVIVAVSTLGVEMTTFVAILGAAGVAVGLAVKDSLSNFAGGVLLLTFRPFNVGDFIEVGDKSGTVKQIEILYTHINTVDNKRVVIPNGELANEEITNYSTESERRVDIVLGIGYDNDIDHARSVIKKILEEHETVLNTPEPIIKVDSLGDNAVNIIVKAWTKNEDYLNTYYDLQEIAKKKFDEEKIEMPFPQRDIHLYNESIAINN